MSRYLFVMDPLESVDPNGDTTFDFLLESQSRDVENLVCQAEDLWTDGRKGFAQTRRVEVRRPSKEGERHCTVLEEQSVCFDDVDVIWMRKDPPVDDAFMLSTMLLDRHDKSRTLMMNDPAGLRVANEKLWGLFADDISPRTVVSANPAVLVETIEKMGKGVLKPIGFAGGMGVMVLAGDDKNLRAAADLLTAGGRPALAQEYIPAARDGDKRVILLGGEPIGAVLRVPQENDHRANMHVGGSVRQVDVDEKDRAIAARLKPGLLELGLHFVGIDVIDGKCTEVNVTSPTGVQEIDRLDGRRDDARMSAQVMTYVEKELAKRP